MDLSVISMTMNAVAVAWPRQPDGEQVSFRQDTSWVFLGPSWTLRSVDMYIRSQIYGPMTVAHTADSYHSIHPHFCSHSVPSFSPCVLVYLMTLHTHVYS